MREIIIILLLLGFVNGIFTAPVSGLYQITVINGVTTIELIKEATKEIRFYDLSK